MSSDGIREPLRDAAESKTLSMRRNSVRGNRETLETPAPQGVGRSGKALCRKPDMNVLRESDGLIVPTKRANKAGLKAAAESVEGRGPTKGNGQSNLTRAGHSAGKSVESDRWAYEQRHRGTHATPLIVTTRGKSRMR